MLWSFHGGVNGVGYCFATFGMCNGSFTKKHVMVSVVYVCVFLYHERSRDRARYIERVRSKGKRRISYMVLRAGQVLG